MHIALTKADIVDAVNEKTDSTRWEARKHVETLLAIMKAAIVHDHALLLSGFGKFEAYVMPARKGRNPSTNETMKLEARKVVVFRVSKKFRGVLN